MQQMGTQDTSSSRRVVVAPRERQRHVHATAQVLDADHRARRVVEGKLVHAVAHRRRLGAHIRHPRSCRGRLDHLDGEDLVAHRRDAGRKRHDVRGVVCEHGQRLGLQWEGNGRQTF